MKFNLNSFRENDDDDLIQFIDRNDESYFLEYKMLSNMNQVEKSIARTICAFINSGIKKGILMVGIDDDKKIIGCSFDIEKIQDKLSDIINPTPYYKHRTVTINSKKIHIFETVEMKNLPYCVNGTFYKRIGHSSKKINNVSEIVLLNSGKEKEAKKQLKELLKSPGDFLASTSYFKFITSNDSSVLDSSWYFKFIEKIKYNFPNNFIMIDLTKFVVCEEQFTISFSIEDGLTYKFYFDKKDINLNLIDKIINTIYEELSKVANFELVFLYNLSINSGERNFMCNGSSFDSTFNWFTKKEVTDREKPDFWYPYYLYNDLINNSFSKIADDL